MLDSLYNTKVSKHKHNCVLLFWRSSPRSSVSEILSGVRANEAVGS
jgi:hypothetical protein